MGKDTRVEIEILAKDGVSVVEKQIGDNTDKLTQKMRSVQQATNGIGDTLGKQNGAVASSAGKFNMLNMSVQQVVRELPSASMGMNMFFLAISNNLPILADSIKMAKEQNVAMKGLGQQTVPVWKQVIGSIFSWQSAMMIGVTILTMFGGKIIDFVGDLFKSKNALDDHTKAQRMMTESMKEAAKEAAVEKTKLDLLYKATQDANSPLKERKVAVKELQSQYPAYFGNLSQEAILAGNAANAYRQLAADLIKAAMARAYEKRVEKLAERNATLSIYENANNNYFKRTKGKLETAQRKNIQQQQYVAGVTGGVTAGFTESGVAQLGSTMIKDPIIEEHEKRVKTQEKIIKEMESNNKMMEVLQEKALTYNPVKNKVDGTLLDTPKKGKAAKDYQNELNTLQEMSDAARLKIEENRAGMIESEYDREREQAKANFEKEKERIEDEENKRNTLVAKLRKAGYVVSAAQEQEIEADAATQRTQAAQIYAAEVDKINQKEIDAGVKKGEKEQEEMDRLLGKYQSYSAKRIEIEKTFTADVKALNANRNSNNSSEIDSAISEAAKVRDKELKQVNDSELEEMKKSSDFLVTLFEDSSRKSVKEIEDIIAKLKILQQYMSAMGTSDMDTTGTATIRDKKGKAVSSITAKDITGIGFTPADLGKLKSSPESLKVIMDQWDKLTKQTESRNPFKALADSVNDLFSGKTAKGKGTEEKIMKLGGAAADVADQIGQVAGNLSAMFEAAGNESAAQAMDDIQGIMNSVSNIAKGFAQGGVVGGTMAILNETINLATKAFAAEARHKEALRQIMNENIAQQRAYNLLLIQQNLEYEKGTTIFGSDAYGKAKNALNVMKKVSGDLGKAMTGLSDIDIVNGHKKTGLFGWGKGKDTYGNILKEIPNLIDANGKLNVSQAEVALNTRRMSDESKAALQNMIDLANAEEDAWKQVTDYMTSVFGEFGQSVSDVMHDAFESGEDAGMAFVDKMGNLLEKLSRQMIDSVTIAPILQQAQDEMMKVMKNSELSDEEKYKKYLDITDNMLSGVSSQEKLYMDYMNKYKEMAAAHGIKIFEGESSTTEQNGKSGAFTTMTQDEGRKLEGLFMSGQIHWAAIDGYTEDVAKKMDIVSGSLKKIEENTGFLGRLQDIDEAMKRLERDGVKIK